MLQQINATVTNSAAAVSGLPATASFVHLNNPHATASVAFTLDGSTPVVGANGITLGPLGQIVWASHNVIPLAGMKAISSVASQSFTILAGSP